MRLLRSIYERENEECMNCKYSYAKFVKDGSNDGDILTDAFGRLILTCKNKKSPRCGQKVGYNSWCVYHKINSPEVESKPSLEEAVA